MSEVGEFLSEKEAAGVLRLSGHALRKWRQLRTGPPYIQVSPRCIRYRRVDVLAWIEARRIQPQQAQTARERRLIPGA